MALIRYCQTAAVERHVPIIPWCVCTWCVSGREPASAYVRLRSHAHAQDPHARTHTKRERERERERDTRAHTCTHIQTRAHARTHSLTLTERERKKEREREREESTHDAWTHAPDLEDPRACMHACKRVHALLPSSTHACDQRVWARLRTALAGKRVRASERVRAGASESTSDAVCSVDRV